MKKIIQNWIDVAFLAAGMILISIGVFLIYVPAGFIVLGGCFIAIAFFIARLTSRKGVR